MRGSTLERNRIAALHVGSVSIVHLLYTDIQETITVITKCDTIMHQAIECQPDKSVLTSHYKRHI